MQVIGQMIVCQDAHKIRDHILKPCVRLRSEANMRDSQYTPACAQKILALPIDQIGMWTSGLCIVHCLLTPVLLSLSTVFAHFLPSEERIHRLLAVFIALVGAIALVRCFQRHRRRRVIFLMAGGLACIFLAAFQGDRLHSHVAEIGVTFLGSLLMISAHRLNHTFCKDCACTEN
jgi:hypothetical protein